LSVPDEGYSRNVPDEGYSRNVHDEGYWRNVSCIFWAYLMKVIPETCRVDFERTWWRLFQKHVV